MHYFYPDCVLMIFCKAPIPGQVKTRLIGELTADQAADAHAELSRATIRLACQQALCKVQLWGTPSLDHPFFRATANAYPIALRLQQGRDLGERMAHAFRSALAEQSSAILIGCDCPSLTVDDLADALAALNSDSDDDAALAPAEDGGYALIGLKRACPELFADMPWGTNEVLDRTRRRFELLGLKCRELRPQWDVDTPSDWRRYRERLAFAAKGAG